LYGGAQFQDTGHRATRVYPGRPTGRPGNDIGGHVPGIHLSRVCAGKVAENLTYVTLQSHL